MKILFSMGIIVFISFILGCIEDINKRNNIKGMPVILNRFVMFIIMIVCFYFGGLLRLNF